MKEQIKNVAPNSTQTLVLDVSKVKTPIELNVNQATDYWALSITLVVTIITSAITAFVTIFLVTKSNAKLIENQNLQNDKQYLRQEELLKIQIASQESEKNKELNAHYKQLWLDKLRDFGTQFLYNTSIVTTQLLKTINIRNLHKTTNSINYEEVVIEFNKLSEIVKNLEIYKISLQFYLNKNHESDNKIDQILNEIILLTKNLNANAINELTNKNQYKQVNYNDISNLPEVKKLLEAEIDFQFYLDKLIQEERYFISN